MKLVAKKTKKPTHFRYLEPEPWPVTEEVYTKIEVEFPKNIPDLSYKLFEVVDEKDVRMAIYDGNVRFKLKGWDKDVSQLEVGHCLYIGNLNYWYHTSLITEVMDHDEFLMFKTRSGSIYKITPIVRSPDYYLNLRNPPKKQKAK